MNYGMAPASKMVDLEAEEFKKCYRNPLRVVSGIALAVAARVSHVGILALNALNLAMSIAATVILFPLCLLTGTDLSPLAVLTEAAFFSTVINLAHLPVNAISIVAPELSYRVILPMLRNSWQKTWRLIDIYQETDVVLGR
jgi:hypothetical protein